MHKQEAAKLFKVLGDEDRVKMMKMLCVRGDLLLEKLSYLIGNTNDKFLLDLKTLEENGLIVLKENNIISANRPLVDELLAFIVTACNCCK